MLNKILYLALVILIPVNVVLTYRNIRGVNMSKIESKFTQINVLPLNKNKELKDPKQKHTDFKTDKWFGRISSIVRVIKKLKI